MTQLSNITTNIFNVFPEYSGNTVANKKQTLSNSISIEKVNEDEFALQSAQKKKTKRKILFGSTIASTVLTAGIIGLVLAKGVHGSALKNKIEKLAQKLTKDIQESSQHKASDLPNRIAYSAKKGLKKVLDLLQASSNFTTFKDWGSSQLLEKTKPTRAFAKKSTSFFKGVVDKTLGKKYNKVEVDIKDLTSLLKHYDIAKLKNLSEAEKAQKVTIKGATKTLNEWITILEKQTTRLETTFDSNFSKGARKLRDTKRTRLLQDLPAKIKNRFFGEGKKSLFNVDNYRTYSTEDLSKPAQEILRKDISTAKKEITNNIQSITSQVKQNINSFANNVKPEDELTRKTVQTLRQQMEAFKGCSGSNEAKAREKIAKEISSVIDDLYQSMTTNSSIYTTEEQKVMQNILTEIRTNISSATTKGSKGALEEIMTILKGLNGTKLKGSKEALITNTAFKDFSKMSQRISSGLKSATDLETGEYFLKQAELKVGSAPNDVISVLFPIGVGAYAIAKGDDKDEKISAVLTTCIPLVGTFATFVYGTSKMLSGAKNLIFSGVSGFLLGFLGDYCDKLYKKYKNPESVQEVVKDGYNKIWTGIEDQMHKFDEPDLMMQIKEKEATDKENENKKQAEKEAKTK